MHTFHLYYEIPIKSRAGAFDQNSVTRRFSGKELFSKEPKFDKRVVPSKCNSPTNKNPDLTEGILAKHLSAKPIFTGDVSEKLHESSVTISLFCDFSGDKNEKKKI